MDQIHRVVASEGGRLGIARSFFGFFVFSEFFVVNLYCFYRKKMKTLTKTHILKPKISKIRGERL